MTPLIRYDWTLLELKELYDLPFFHLLSKAHQVHCRYHPLGEIQVCHLISIKTGGCSEDCKYCAQSSHYRTPVSAQPMMKYEEVIHEAKQAAARGATRICLGAAWREVRDTKPFEEILKMIEGITALGLEVCCTLGMLQNHQLQRMKEKGLYAYNHNLDSSEEHYRTIVTTRTYQERLDTLDRVEKAGIHVCCGGILGIGETVEDRLKLLLTLSQRNPHPSSVPINRLAAVAGTPFENHPQVTPWEYVRIAAMARILMPQSMVRLSAGRLEMTYAEQALCFFAGVNSIFEGEKLLTVANPTRDRDAEMFQLLNLKKQPPHVMARTHDSSI